MRNGSICAFAAILFLGLPAASQTRTAQPILTPLAATSPADTVERPVAVAKEPRPPVSFGSDGLQFRSKNETFKAKLHGYIEGDGRFFSSDIRNASKDTLLFRRVRPIFEGTLFKALDFRFMPDFGQGIAVIQDAYVETRVPRFTKVRIGKFKAPVGLEQLQSDVNLMFVERSLVTGLIPNRDLGVQVGGDAEKKSVVYAIGFFDGVPDNSNAAFDWHTGNTVAARLFVQPFRSLQGHVLQGFGVGVGGSTGRDYGSLPKYKTIGQDTFFKYASGTVAAGQHNRLSPQAYFYRGRYGLMGEYAISSQEVRNSTATARVRHEGWQVENSLLLTGGENSYEGVRPTNGFEPNRNIRHWGGVELVARYSMLRMDPDAFPKFASPTTSAQKAGEWAVGINWYPNRFLKLMTDYEQTAFHMVSDKGHLATEKVVMSRIQLAF